MAHRTDETPLLPRAPIDVLVKPVSRFLHVEAASGVLLLLCTLVALGAANSSHAAAWLGFWEIEFELRLGSFEFHHSLKHLVNDGLMAIFFFVIGLEVKRELVHGELRDIRSAALPLAAALGGMLAPALIYLVCIRGGDGQRGWGIPMATDIAFVVGCMAILGPRVPRGLRIMMLTLAIADDIGAILVIAIGYSEGLNLAWLSLGAVGIAFVSIIARLGVRSFPVYTASGVFIWYAFHESGVHATVAGVILGLMTPASAYLNKGLLRQMLRTAEDIFDGDAFAEREHRGEKVRYFQRVTRETISPLEYLETTLHPWSSFCIMPIFALANAGVPIAADAMGTPIALAVMLGLVVGKPLGIVLFSWLAVKSRLARLPEGAGWPALFAGGCLAGIGFTMALFIAGLALEDQQLVTAKIGVLTGSAISAVLGMLLFLFMTSRVTNATVENNKS